MLGLAPGLAAYLDGKTVAVESSLKVLIEARGVQGSDLLLR